MQSKMCDETEKRLEYLYDRLAMDNVPPIVLATLVQITQGTRHLTNNVDIQSRNYARAMSAVMSLMTSNYENETKWIVGLKRLVDYLARK
jgi:hypothetical protein